MRAKWRLLIVLGYASLLVWEMVTLISPYGELELLSFESALLLVALSPIAVLSLVPRHHDAMGILALLVIGLGIWLYDVNDGDPIGLMIIIFYQYCVAGIGALAVVLGSHLLKAKS
jgi:hypothetical protein